MISSRKVIHHKALAYLSGARRTSNVPLSGTHRVCVHMHQQVHKKTIFQRMINPVNISAWVWNWNAMRAQHLCYVLQAPVTQETFVMIEFACTNQWIQMQYCNKRPCHGWICFSHIYYCLKSEDIWFSPPPNDFPYCEVFLRKSLLCFSETISCTFWCQNIHIRFC